MDKMTTDGADLLIYDIGMHNGDDTAYYLSLGHRVIAVDASPDLVQKASNRFANAIAEGKLEIMNIGIADQEGTFDFYQNRKNSVWNSFDKTIGARENADIEVIKIATKRIDQVVREKGMPYYMKIDIEGNDITCLTSLIEYGSRPQYISVEVNNEDLIIKLKTLGYTKFKIIEQTNFVPMELPPLKEFIAMKRHKEFKGSMNFFVRVVRKLFGRTVNSYFERQYKYWFDYDFPYGSSGPFGESLPGRWLDYDEAIKTYYFYKDQHAKSKFNTGYNYWIDIHATN